MVPGTLEAKDDPDGRGMKNSLWGSVTSGTAATDFSWWWDAALIDGPNHTAYYAHYDGIARFVEQIDFPRYNWTTHICNCKASPTACVATCMTGVPLGPLGNRESASGITLLWARNANFTYLPASRPLSMVINATVEIVCMYSRLPPLPAAGSSIQWFNTTTGEAVGAQEPAVIAPAPGPNPPYPVMQLTRPFLKDVAAVIRGPVQQVRCEGGSQPPGVPASPPIPPLPPPPPSPSPLDAIIRNGVPWYDTDGKRMYFGGANMYQEADVYYLVGSGEKVADLSECFNLYRSTDLQAWKNLGCVLNVSDLRVPPPFAPPFRMERPKLFRCPSMSAGPAYRLVFHCDTRNFNMRSIGVLVADQVEGPYTQVRRQDQQTSLVSGYLHMRLLIVLFLLLHTEHAMFPTRRGRQLRHRHICGRCGAWWRRAGLPHPLG